MVDDNFDDFGGSRNMDSEQGVYADDDMDAFGDSDVHRDLSTKQSGLVEHGFHAFRDFVARRDMSSEQSEMVDDFDASRNMNPEQDVHVVDDFDTFADFDVHHDLSLEQSELIEHDFHAFDDFDAHRDRRWEYSEMVDDDFDDFGGSRNMDSEQGVYVDDDLDGFDDLAACEWITPWNSVQINDVFVESDCYFVVHYIRWYLFSDIDARLCFFEEDVNPLMIIFVGSESQVCYLRQRACSLLMVGLVLTVVYVCMFRERLMFWQSGRGIGCTRRFVFFKVLID